MTCFGQFLCDHKMATSFARYMHSIYSEEELEFWLDVELFRLDTKKCKRQLAQDIYEKYLTTSSLQQIHVDSELVKEVATTLSTTPMVDPFDCRVFDRAQDAIEGVLVSDCMLRFKEILKNSNPATFPQCPSSLASKLRHYHKLSSQCNVSKQQRPQVSPSIFSTLFSLFHTSSVISPPTSPLCSPSASPTLSPRSSPTLPLATSLITTNNPNTLKMPTATNVITPNNPPSTTTNPPPLPLSPCTSSDNISIPKSKTPPQLSILIPSTSPPSSPPPSPPASVPLGFTFTTQSQTVPSSYRVSMHRLHHHEPPKQQQPISPPQPLSPATLSIPTAYIPHPFRVSAPEVIKGFSFATPPKLGSLSEECPTPLSPISPLSHSASSLPQFFPTVPSTQLEVLKVLAGHRSVPNASVLESKDKLVS